MIMRVSKLLLLAFVAGSLGVRAAPLGSVSNAICLENATYAKPLHYALTRVEGFTDGMYLCPPNLPGIQDGPVNYQSHFVHFHLCLPEPTSMMLSTTVKHLPIVMLDSLGNCTDFVESGEGVNSTGVVSRSFGAECVSVLIPFANFTAADFLDVTILEDSFGLNATTCYDPAGVWESSAGTPANASETLPPPSTSTSVSPPLGAASSPLPVPASAGAGAVCDGSCIGEFRRCGGKSMNFKTGCCDGTHCVQKNAFFAQCRAVSADVPTGWDGSIVPSPCP